MRTAFHLVVAASLAAALTGCQQPNALLKDLGEQGVNHPKTSKIVFVDMTDAAVPPESRRRAVVTEPDIINYVWKIIDKAKPAEPVEGPRYLVEFYTGISQTIPSATMAVNSAGVVVVWGGNRDRFGHIARFFECHRLYELAQIYVENRRLDRGQVTGDPTKP